MTKEQAAAIWPVMKAYSEGKQVQGKGSFGDWIDVTCPSFASSEWRVAPEKREIRGWVNVYPNRLSCPYSTKEEADVAAYPDRIACVEVRGEYEVPADQ